MLQSIFKICLLTVLFLVHFTCSSPNKKVNLTPLEHCKTNDEFESLVLREIELADQLINLDTPTAVRFVTLFNTFMHYHLGDTKAHEDLNIKYTDKIIKLLGCEWSIGMSYCCLDGTLYFGGPFYKTKNFVFIEENKVINKLYEEWDEYYRLDSLKGKPLDD